MPSDIATPTRRSARVNATASTSTTPAVAPSQNLRKRARPAAAEPLPSKSTPLKAAKRRKLTEEPVVEEVKDVKGKGRAKAMLPPPPPAPAPERPNHRKRKSMSALDDAVVLKKDLLAEAEVEAPAGRRTRKKQKSEEGIQEEPRKTRATAAKTVETPAAASRKGKVQPVRPPTVRRITRSLHAAPATPALPVTTTATATANPPRQPPSPALSALSSLPPSPSTSPIQTRSMPPLSLAGPPPPVSANAVVQRQTDAVAPTTRRITRYAEKKEEAPSRAGSPTPSTRSPLATSAVLEPEESPTGKGKKGKARAKTEVKQGTKRKRGSPAPAGPIRRSTRLHPGAEPAASTSTTPAASSPLAAHPVASASSTKAAAPVRSTPASPSILPPPLSLSLAQLSPPQVAQRHQGHHGGPRSSPVSPLAPPHESLPPVTPPLPSANLGTNPLVAESSVSTVTASTPSSPTRSPQMTLDRMDFGTLNLPSMGSIPALSLGPSSLGFGNASSSGSGNGGKKAAGNSSPRTSPLLRPMVPSALGLGMVTAGKISPVAEKTEEASIARTQPSAPVVPLTPSLVSTTPTPATEESRPIVDAPSPTPTSTSKVSDDTKERARSPSPAPSQQSTVSDHPQVSSSPPLPSPLQDGALLPQLPLTSTIDVSYSSVVEEQPRPTTPAPFAHQQPQQIYTQQRYELYQDTPATPLDGQFRPSSPAPEQVHHHTPPPLHTHTYSLADALGSPPPSPVQVHHSEEQAPIPGEGLAQIQIPEGVQQIQIPEATPQEIVQLQQQQQQPGGLVQVQLEAAPQSEQGQEMQVAAPVPLPVSATTPPPQVAAAYQPVWEEPPRLDTEKNLWRLACKVRVWDLRRRYSPEAIRALVTQEAHEYYEKHGFPIGYFHSSRSAAAGPSSLRNPVAYGGQPVSSYTPASPLSAGLSTNAVVGGSGKEDGSSPGTSPVGLHFMDEPVYDWEINSNSDDEDDLEAEFDEEDYEDDDIDEEESESEKKDAEVKGKGKAKEEVEGEQQTKTKRSPRKKRKLEADASTPKKRAASAPTPGSTLEGDSEKDMEVESEEDEDLEEVNTDTTPTPTAASPTSEQHQQQQLDAEALAEEEARRRDLDEALADPSFNLELSSPTATSPTTLAFSEGGAGRERSLSPSSPSTSPGGAFTAFYVPPAPRTVGMYGGTLDASGEPPEPTVEQDMEGGYQETPPQSITPPPASPLQVHLQMPMSPILEIPPPRLSTVPVWALRSMDMMVGGSMGRGTPVDKERKMEWITVTPRYSSPTPMSPVISAVDGGVKKEQGEGSADDRDRKPVLRLAMPGEDSGVGTMAAPPLHNSGGGRSGASEKIGGGLGDAPFEPSDADWAAFLADLAAGGAQSSSGSSLPGPSSDPQGYSQHEYQGHPPPYTPSSSTTLTLPGQHQQQQQQQHPAFGMNVNMNLTNMFNGVPVSGSPTTVMNFMPMHHHNMGHNNLMNMGGMGNLSMPPLASPMPIGVNQPLSSPGLGVPPSMSPPHSTSAPPTPPPNATSLVNVPMNMFGMGFGGNVQIGGASLQLGLTVSLTPGVGNNVGNSWFGSPPSSPPALSIGPDGNLIQDSQQPQQSQGAGSYSSPTTPTHEFDASNAMFGMGQMQNGMSGAMGVVSYGHPLNMGVAMGMGNGMGSGVAMGVRDGMSGSHAAPPSSPGGNGDGHDGSGSAPTSPAQTSTPSTLSFALG